MNCVVAVSRKTGGGPGVRPPWAVPSGPRPLLSLVPIKKPPHEVGGTRTQRLLERPPSLSSGLRDEGVVAHCTPGCVPPTPPVSRPEGLKFGHRWVYAG